MCKDNYFLINEDFIRLRDILNCFRKSYKIRLSDEVRDKIERNRSIIVKYIKRGDRVIYGVNTGLGELKDKILPSREVEKLQENMLMSHAVGVGKPASLDIVKLTILFRVISLSRGYSGIRSIILDKLIETYNKDIHLFIPLEGSVGASGDLAPLAHLGLFLIGKGKVVRNSQPIEFDYKEFKPIRLKEKEGLALINGTSYSLALLTINYLKFVRVLDILFNALALTFNALKGNIEALSSFIHSTKYHNGQRYAAYKLRRLLDKSYYVINSKSGSDQDAYSLRCIPQVLGPVIDTLLQIRHVIENEINSVSDNPLFDEEGNPYNGCNFHAMYIAIASDYLKIDGGVIANLIERLLFRMLDANLSKGLPPFLTKRPGRNTGLMILQYTAASLTAKIRDLSTPSSIHNIPTSANQEDLVSMSVPSLTTLAEIVDSLEILVSALILSSIIGIEIRRENMGTGNIGSKELENFYNKCKRLVNIEIKESDKIYYEDLYTLKESLFPESLNNFNYVNVEDLIYE